jgi:hypothetical protein
MVAKNLHCVLFSTHKACSLQEDSPMMVAALELASILQGLVLLWKAPLLENG